MKKLKLIQEKKYLLKLVENFQINAFIEIFEKSKLKIVKDFRDEKNYYSLYLLNSGYKIIYRLKSKFYFLL